VGLGDRLDEGRRRTTRGFQRLSCLPPSGDFTPFSGYFTFGACTPVRVEVTGSTHRAFAVAFMPMKFQRSVQQVRAALSLLDGHGACGQERLVRLAQIRQGRGHLFGGRYV
jgi:hypothetical protein